MRTLYCCKCTTLSWVQLFLRTIKEHLMKISNFTLNGIFYPSYKFDSKVPSLSSLPLSLCRSTLFGCVGFIPKALLSDPSMDVVTSPECPSTLLVSLAIQTIPSPSPPDPLNKIYRKSYDTGQRNTLFIVFAFAQPTLQL